MPDSNGNRRVFGESLFRLLHVYQRDLVTRRANPRDRRCPIIECTEAGQALIESIMAIHREAGACMARA